MRSRARHVTLTFLVLLVTIALVPIGCQGSNTVTGPSGGAVAPAANIAGAWSGSYQSDDLTGCGSSTATAIVPAERRDGQRATFPLRPAA